MKGYFLIFAPLLAQAAEQMVQTDIVPRSINFTIFAVILYFLVAKHIKQLLSNHREKIEQKLSAIEDELNAVHQLKKEATAKIEEASQQAIEIVNAAKIQIAAAKESILQGAQLECDTLDRQFKERCEFDNDKARKEIIAEALDALVGAQVAFSENELLNLVEKKAS